MHLNIREKEVIKGLASFFNLYVTRVNLNLSEISTVSETENLVKYKNIYISENKVKLMIMKISDIVNTIIPFFEKYPIVGIKSLDFADFKKVAEMVKSKKHLTPEGFKTILEIKSNMNQNRKW
jgi:hypothetical protein